jgi:hypothetical protein
MEQGIRRSPTRILFILAFMINVNELRLGNYILQKIANRVTMVKCGYPHFELVAKEGTKNLYPVVLKASLLEDSGFKENMDYPLLPQAHEFILALPVIGSQKTEIRAYVKNNGECFARASLNALPASNNIYHLHQLQNLCFSLTGAELSLNIR